MTDPIRLLEEYGAEIDASIDSIGIDEVRGTSAMITAARTRFSMPVWVTAAAAAAVVLVMIGGGSLLLGGGGGTAPADDPVSFDDLGTTTPAVVSSDTVVSNTVRVSLEAVTGQRGKDLAGVVYPGADLTALDGGAVGGFWAVVDASEYATTKLIVEPAADGVGRYPYVTDEPLTVEPGTYTLVLWLDTSLGSWNRWIPVNTDGAGLIGCRQEFEVTDAGADISLSSPMFAPNGWTIDCTTGVAVPGLDPHDAVNPWSDEEHGFDGWFSEEPLDAEMPPVIGTVAGSTVTVSVVGITGHWGHELAGVLYANDDLTDLGAGAVGGFWAVVEQAQDYSATEILRTPGVDGEGRFPYVASEALIVEPGIYTLVLWMDTSLGSFNRWVPINTDGMGLLGCRHVFEVSDESVEVSLRPTLHPDGWTTDCTSGLTRHGVDPAQAVDPRLDE